VLRTAASGNALRGARDEAGNAARSGGHLFTL